VLHAFIYSFDDSVQFHAILATVTILSISLIFGIENGWLHCKQVGGEKIEAALDDSNEKLEQL
jgi:hypothetical protein